MSLPVAFKYPFLHCWTHDSPSQTWSSYQGKTQLPKKKKKMIHCSSHTPLYVFEKDCRKWIRMNRGNTEIKKGRLLVSGFWVWVLNSENFNFLVRLLMSQAPEFTIVIRKDKTLQATVNFAAAELDTQRLIVMFSLLSPGVGMRSGDRERSAGARNRADSILNFGPACSRSISVSSAMVKWTFCCLLQCRVCSCSSYLYFLFFSAPR